MNFVDPSHVNNVYSCFMMFVCLHLNVVYKVLYQLVVFMELMMMMTFYFGHFLHHALSPKTSHDPVDQPEGHLFLGLGTGLIGLLTQTVIR